MIARCKGINNAIKADDEVLYLDVFRKPWGVIPGLNEISCMYRKEFVESTRIVNFLLVLELYPEISRLLLC